MDILQEITAKEKLVTMQYMDHLYTDICASLHTSSGSCIPSSGCNTASQFMVPGWNDHVRDVHTEARHAYVTWRDFGKPRSGPV